MRRCRGLLQRDVARLLSLSLSRMDDPGVQRRWRDTRLQKKGDQNHLKAEHRPESARSFVAQFDLGRCKVSIGVGVGVDEIEGRL